MLDENVKRRGRPKKSPGPAASTGQLTARQRAVIEAAILKVAPTRREFARNIGMDESQLSKALRGSLTLQTLQRIAAGANVTLGEVFGGDVPHNLKAGNIAQFRSWWRKESELIFEQVDTLVGRTAEQPPQLRELHLLRRRMPMVGHIAAGRPMLAEEHVDAEVIFDESTQFFLQVHGESMVDAHIYDGDWVHVLKTDDYRVGDVVAARVKGAGEATVKYFGLGGQGTIVLTPANERAGLTPEQYDLDALEIEGKVLAVYRPIESRPAPRRLRRVAERKTPIGEERRHD